MIAEGLYSYPDCLPQSSLTPCPQENQSGQALTSCCVGSRSGFGEERRPPLTPQTADLEPAKIGSQLEAGAVELHLGRLLREREEQILRVTPSQSRRGDSLKETGLFESCVSL